MSIYKGFSSLQFTNKKSFILSDVDVIRQDILNNIYTRRGERVKMFEYGTRIPDLIFEPMDESTIYMIGDDLRTVFNNDPRVTLKDIQIIPLYDQNAIAVYADVYYVYLNFGGIIGINIQFSGGNSL